MKLSIVIPVYNERDTILSVIDKVASTPFEKEIVVVDDCSRDGTRDVLKDLKRDDCEVRVFFHEVNQGKGAALRTGFSKVQGDIVIIQDADLEYTPDDYGKLIKPITDGNADVVFGSRFLGGTHRCHLFWHYVVNKALTTASNVFTNLNLSDMETCYKVFRREVADRIKIESNRFAVEPELTAKVAAMRCRVYEVPISYFGRDYSEGKKIGWKDGFKALWCIVRYGLAD
jgi:glycosyltransferase involved in cell wall biosynthesis